MKTSEILEHITGHMLDDRANLIEGASDELFSDDVVIRYLNEAERKLCRDAWVLEDITTPACCEIVLRENISDYPYHKAIIHIKAVRLSDTEIDLFRVGYEDNSLRPQNSLYDTDVSFDVNVAQVDDPGRPSQYSCDMGTRILKVRRKPDATSALLRLKLSVVRMPVVPMSVDNLEKEPEVPEEHHLELASYAAGKCLSNSADIDASLRTLGREWVSEFDDRCAKAQRDRERRQQSEHQFRFGGWARS